MPSFLWNGKVVARPGIPTSLLNTTQLRPAATGRRHQAGFPAPYKDGSMLCSQLPGFCHVQIPIIEYQLRKKSQSGITGF